MKARKSDPDTILKKTDSDPAGIEAGIYSIWSRALHVCPYWSVHTRCVCVIVIADGTYLL